MNPRLKPVEAVVAMLLIIFVLSVTAAVIFTLPAVAGGQEDRITALVSFLDSPKYEERDSASRELERIGEPARAFLEGALRSTSPEVTTRAKAILAQLDIDKMWQPTMFDYDCKALGSDIVIAKLAKATGNHVEAGDHFVTSPGGVVTLASGPKPYWAVLDDICKQIDGRFRPHYDNRKPGLVVHSGKSNYPTAHSGPVYGRVTSARRMFSEQADFDSIEPDITHSFNINITMMWEDRLRVVAYRSQANVIRAVTDTGVEVNEIGSTINDWEIVTESTRQVNMSPGFQPPPLAAKKFSQLTMRWELLAVGNPATIEVTELSKPGKYLQDDVTLDIVEWLKDTSNKCGLVILLHRDNLITDPPMTLTNSVDVVLADSNNSAWNKTRQVWRQTPEGMRGEFWFAAEKNNTQPAALRFTYPRIQAKKEIEITFRDVPLPSTRPE